jgi:hypothetical protein
MWYRKNVVSMRMIIDTDVVVAVAEKVSALRTAEYFRERASRANIEKAKRILKRAGRGKAPLAGDEL